MEWTNAATPPTEDGKYLVTRYDPTTKKEFVDMLWYENGEWWNGMFHDNFYVIGYQPLPYPYKYRQYLLSQMK